MNASVRITFEKDWRSAPLAFWVHIPIEGAIDKYEPAAPIPFPNKGYAFLRFDFEEYELQFSSLPQLEHFIKVLSLKPLPTSRRLSNQRGSSAGPNGHWLSRLPAKLKSPRKREKLVAALQAVNERALKQANFP